MDRSELESLKNELKQIYDKSIAVINQDGFLVKSQVPSGKKVYNIEASIMFIDIRSSTALTDAIGRKNMVKIYKMYTKLCKKAVNERNGIILQIVGDGILSAFTNDSSGNSGQRAVDAAITINTYIAGSMNPLLDSNWKINCGIGICTGHLYVTRLITDNGSEVAYPSDITNYASKFCGLAHKDEIILDEKTHEHLSNHFKTYCESYASSLENIYIIKEATWTIE